MRIGNENGLYGDGEAGSSGDTTSGGGNCENSHLCVNGACECTNDGVDGNACADPDDTSASAADQCPQKCRVRS